nr:NF038122 family metalloprotease [uncultured Rhodopila sp.]
MSNLTKIRLNAGVPQLDSDDASLSTFGAISADNSAASGAAVLGAGTTSDTVRLAGSGIVFNNTYGSGVTAAFKDAIITAENFFQSHFSNSVTLNLTFNLASISNQFSGQNNFSNVTRVSYATLVAALDAHATTAEQQAADASLPSADPSGGTGFAIPAGMAEILGLKGTSTTTDDSIVLNANMAWTFGADAVGVLEHEISEGAMGRIGGLGVQNGWWAPMDLFRYSAPGVRDYTGGTDGLPTYFSVNGTTLLTQFHNSLNTAGVFDGQDFADWNATSGDAFGPGGPGDPGTMSATDMSVMDVLGWTPVAAPSTPANFVVTDTTTNTTSAASGTPYAGPVAGIDYQYINITPDNLNITSSVPNVFIHSGAGMDGLNVAAAGGNNILDGSTNSNFLIGGKGNDTFYLDDRNAASPIFSTIVNFHSGDSATVWGVNATDFTLTLLDNQGATGATGLDYIFSAPGHPAASFVLAGYTSADLINGRLTASYGTTPNLPNLPGSEYVTITAT